MRDRGLEQAVLDVVALVVDPKVCIAGGYCRDMYLGSEPKDCDLWAHSTCDPLIVGFWLRSVLRDRGHEVELGPVYDHRMPAEYAELQAEYAQYCRVNGVVSLKVDGKYFDLVLVPQPIDDDLGNVIEKFDVGLCQIGQKRDGKTIFTRAFADDVDNGTLTVFRDTEHSRRLIKRFYWRRVVKRYEDQQAPASA